MLRIPQSPRWWSVSGWRSCSRTGACWLYGGIGLLTLAFLPEARPGTKGKRLEDIQAVFQERASRHDRSA